MTEAAGDKHAAGAPARSRATTATMCGAVYLAAWFALNVALTFQNKMLLRSSLTAVQLTLCHTAASLLLALLSMWRANAKASASSAAAAAAAAAASGDKPASPRASASSHVLAALVRRAGSPWPWAAGVLFGVNIVFGNYALAVSPLYLMQTLRCSTPVMVSLLVWMAGMRLPSTRRKLLGLLVVVLSSSIYLYGQGDARQNIDMQAGVGLAFAAFVCVASNFVSAGKSVLSSWMLQRAGLSTDELLVFCSAVTCAMLAVVELLNGTFDVFLGAPGAQPWALLLNVAIAAALNVCNFGALKEGVSAITINILGNVKNVFTVLIGIPLFGVHLAPFTVVMSFAVLIAGTFFLMSPEAAAPDALPAAAPGDAAASKPGAQQTV